MGQNRGWGVGGGKKNDPVILYHLQTPPTTPLVSPPTLHLFTELGCTQNFTLMVHLLFPSLPFPFSPTPLLGRS